jgi:hypothetical protein
VVPPAGKQVLLVESQTNWAQQVLEAEQVLPAMTHGVEQVPPLQTRPVPVQQSEVTVQDWLAAAHEEPPVEPPPVVVVPASPLLVPEHADVRPPAMRAAARAPRTFFELAFIGGDS